MINKVTKTIYWVFIIILFLIAGAIIVSKLNVPGTFKLYAVESGSMEPAVLKGSIVISVASNTYSKGDVVTYNSDKDKKMNPPRYTTTHRIAEIKKSKTGDVYFTKGDANKTNDPGSISKELILGKVVFSIPFVGYAVSYAKTREGFIIVVIIPAVLVIYSELMNIKKEALLIYERRRKRKLSLAEKVEVGIGKEELAIENGVKNFWSILLKKKRA